MERNFKIVAKVAEATLQKCQKFETLTAALVEEERREQKARVEAERLRRLKGY